MEKWTGELVGQMHLNRVTVQQLAEELEFSKGYVSMILNGKRSPPDAEKKLKDAFKSIVAKRG